MLTSLRRVPQIRIGPCGGEPPLSSRPAISHFLRRVVPGTRKRLGLTPWLARLASHPGQGVPMARGRMFRPEHRAHRKVGPLTHVEYRLWVGMILEADDSGRLVTDPGQLVATVFPYQKRMTHRIVEAALMKLASVGLIVLYEIAGIRYAFFPSWHDWQHPRYPSPSKLPAPGLQQPYRNAPAVLRKDFGDVEVEGEEQEEVEVPPPTPPTPDLLSDLQRLKHKFGGQPPP